jgi:hypothetical protein
VEALDYAHHLMVGPGGGSRVVVEYRSREEAMALAQEHYELCSDIVLQGPGTLEPLAATLMASDWWFFWWD